MVQKIKKYRWRERHRRFIRMEFQRSLENSILRSSRPTLFLANSLGLSSIVQGCYPGVAPLAPETTRFEKGSGTTNPDKVITEINDRGYRYYET
jgi:hypothetical protein